MEHIIAISGLALACGLWVLIQRATGRQSGGCGACGCGSEGSCEKKDAAPADD